MNKKNKKDKKSEKSWKYKRKNEIIGRMIKIYIKWAIAIL